MTKTSNQKERRVTIDDVMRWNPCRGRREIQGAVEQSSASAVEILGFTYFPLADRLWAIVRPDLLTEEQAFGLVLHLLKFSAYEVPERAFLEPLIPDAEALVDAFFSNTLGEAQVQQFIVQTWDYEKTHPTQGAWLCCVCYLGTATQYRPFLYLRLLAISLTFQLEAEQIERMTEQAKWYLEAS